MSQDEYWVIAKKNCYSIPSIVEHLYQTGKFSDDPNNLLLWKSCYEILQVEKSVLVQYLRAKRMDPWFLVVLTACFDASPSFWKKVWKNRPDSSVVDFLPHFGYDPFVITEMLVNLALDNDIFEVQHRGIHTDYPLLTSHFSLLVENDLVLVKEVDIPPEEYAFGPAGYYQVSGPTVLLLGLSPRGESVVNALTRPGCLERAAKASRGKPFEYFVKFVEEVGNGRR